MADFCQQCSIELFGKDFRELAELMPKENYTDDAGCGTLCEGCGPTVVDFDGKCVAAYCEKHGAHKG